MGYRSSVAVATDQEGLDKILKVLDDHKDEYTKPDDIIIDSENKILYWSWIKWYFDDEDELIKVIKSLDYCDYLIQGEDGYLEEYHSDNAPYILGSILAYYNGNQMIPL